MKNIAVISHDSGGAEVLSSWIQFQKLNCLTVVKGPAIDIFEKKGIKNSNYNLLDAIKLSDYVITSTSWQSDLEKEAIIISKKLNKYVISVIDHWVNYEERFILNGILNLPNEIWVTDKHALEIAKSNFLDIKIKRIENYYLKNIETIIKKKITIPKNLKTNFKALFIGENLSEHSLKKTNNINSFGYTEEQALRYLLENFNNLKYEINELKIRPHPSDIKNKYDWSLRYDFVKSISNRNELIDDICNFDFIFGCESMALVIGLIANKKVISCIPIKTKKSSLPFRNIMNLSDLIKKM